MNPIRRLVRFVLHYGVPHLKWMRGTEFRVWRKGAFDFLRKGTVDYPCTTVYYINKYGKVVRLRIEMLSDAEVAELPSPE